jgi:hypothetical protein
MVVAKGALSRASSRRPVKSFMNMIPLKTLCHIFSMKRADDAGEAASSALT